MIIQTTEGYKIPQEQLLNMYPDQFVSDKDKQSKNWIKRNMDYFFTVAVNQFAKNLRTVVRNYELVKGKLNEYDFYNEDNPEVRTMIDNLVQSDHLPSYIQHYSIFSPPINTMIGEMTKRPDNVFVKAFDEDSKSEMFQFKTDLLKQYFVHKVMEQLDLNPDLTDEQKQQMAQETVVKELGSYSTQAEKWGSRVLEWAKMRFSLKEKGEEAFRDLLISGREFFHIYEDNTNLGFNVEVLNPKNVWVLTTPDQKYTSDPYNRNIGAYAAGTIHIMEISEIINKFPVTEEEVKQLRDMSQQAYLLDPTESNLVKIGATGSDSINYDTYNPLILQERWLMESQLKENNTTELENFLGITNNVGVFGNKYMVVQSYWCSKKKVGQLVYIDEDGNEVATLVDDTYKKGTHPNELSLDWDWVNQWYKGVKIGQDIYHVEEFNLFEYCPIIGSFFEIKNLERVKSLVDLLKPYQTIYNILINQLYRLLEKDMGVVFLTSIRHIPVPKDGDYQDAIQAWELDAREKGIVFLDDSPENLKAPSSFNQHAAINMSRAPEMEARIKLAQAMREEAWRLVGITDQRLGSVAATETATGTNTAISQSYSQTEPWFAHHEYTMNKVFQAILDAALYIESHKPVSSLNFITSEGESAFMEVNGAELKLKELGVFITSRQEDAQAIKDMRSLSQVILQNGGSLPSVAEMYSTKSIRRLVDILREDQEKKDQMEQQKQQIDQQRLQQEQQQFQQQQQLAIQQHDSDQNFAAQKDELNRISKEKIALIAANSQEGAPVPGVDTMDWAKLDHARETADRAYQQKQDQIRLEQQKILQQNNLEQQKLQVQRDRLKEEKRRTDAQIKIAKDNKNKPNKK